MKKLLLFFCRGYFFLLLLLAFPLLNKTARNFVASLLPFHCLPLLSSPKGGSAAGHRLLLLYLDGKLRTCQVRLLCITKVLWLLSFQHFAQMFQRLREDLKGKIISFSRGSCKKISQLTLWTEMTHVFLPSFPSFSLANEVEQTRANERQQQRPADMA